MQQSSATDVAVEPGEPASVRRRLAGLPAWLTRLAQIGVLPSDSEELRLRKAVLVLSSTLMASLAFISMVDHIGETSHRVRLT